MRYLILPIILSTTVACGDNTAKPKKRYAEDQEISAEQNDMGVIDDMVVDGGLDCSPLECNRDKLINMIDVERNFEYAALGGFEFEPEPFEFRFDMGD